MDTETGCQGYWSDTPNGRDFDCRYPYAGATRCEDCVFGSCGGTFDPRVNPEEGEMENELSIDPNSNLGRIASLSKRLVQLTGAPEKGLFTWCSAVSDTVRELNEATKTWLEN